jgi:DNA-binding NarL/FixJ family response regulator
MRVQDDLGEPWSRNRDDRAMSPSKLGELHPKTDSFMGMGAHSSDQFDTIHTEQRIVKFDRVDAFLSARTDPDSNVQNSEERKLLVIERRVFLRECFQRSIQSALSIPVETLSSISELGGHPNSRGFRLVIVSLSEGTSQESLDALGLLSNIAPAVPTVILSCMHNFETMRAVIGCGAKAYIPMSVGFEIAIEAVRFVLAGGTYIPAECLLAAIPTAAPLSAVSPTSGVITTRELAVVRAIQQGKSNKIIAYDLNMCEATVKVHVRHVMKKLRAKNRTDVAIKAGHLLSCPKCTSPSDCWSSGRCASKLA